MKEQELKDCSVVPSGPPYFIIKLYNLSTARDMFWGHIKRSHRQLTRGWAFSFELPDLWKPRTFLAAAAGRNLAWPASQSRTPSFKRFLTLQLGLPEEEEDKILKKLPVFCMSQPEKMNSEATVSAKVGKGEQRANGEASWSHHSFQVRPLTRAERESERVWKREWSVYTYSLSQIICLPTYLFLNRW